MSGAHEALEHAEHTAHSGGHGDHGSHKGGSGKIIGLTMALIGVLIALCAAMVGSERNELTKAMILQTQAHSDYTSASTKFRLIMLELEKQRGAMVTAAAAGVAATPESNPVLARFLRLYLDYSSERALSKAWADSYEPVVEAHFEAAEGYEKAQLIAEIGIVLASLGVLLNSRPAWMISIIIAALSIGQLGRTLIHTRTSVGEDQHKVEKAEHAYQALRKAHSGANEDEQTVDQLDPGRKMRTAMEERMKATAVAATHEGSEGKKEEKEEKKE